MKVGWGERHGEAGAQVCLAWLGGWQCKGPDVVLQSLACPPACQLLCLSPPARIANTPSKGHPLVVAAASPDTAPRMRPAHQMVAISRMVSLESE